MIEQSSNFRKFEREFTGLLAKIHDQDWSKDSVNQKYGSQYISSGKAFSIQSVLFDQGWRVINDYVLVEGIPGDMFGERSRIKVTVKLQKSYRSIFGIRTAWMSDSRDYFFDDCYIPRQQKVEAFFSYAKRVMLLNMVGVVGFDSNDDDGNTSSSSSRVSESINADVFAFTSKLNAAHKAGQVTAVEAIGMIDELIASREKPSEVLTKARSSFEMLLESDGETSAEELLLKLRACKSKDERFAVERLVNTSGLSDITKAKLLSSKTASAA